MGMLSEYEIAMQESKPLERLSFQIEWGKKRQDVVKEYFDNKGTKNIIEHFLKSALETEYTDESGNQVLLAEKFIGMALQSELEKGITLKSLESINKLIGGTKSQVIVRGGLELSAKTKELSKWTI